MMESFDFNGRNYKVVNNLAHEAVEPSKSAEHGNVLIPCYRGDNLMLDAYCKNLGVDMYQRPNSMHTHGHQKGTSRPRRNYPIQSENAHKAAMTTKWVEAGDQTDNIKIGKFDLGRIVKLWTRDDHGAEHVGTFFIPKEYKFEDIERYAQEWYQGKSYSVPFEIWIKEKWSVAGVTEVCIPAIYI